MTVSQAARHYGVSRWSIYNRIRKGILVADRGRWGRYENIREPEAPKMEWHPQIHRETAERAGLAPEDFTWLDYPCSDVELSFLGTRDNRQWGNLAFRCRVPADTPEVNRYDRDGQPLPDPKGSALSRVVFELTDLDILAKLDRCPTGTAGDLEPGEVLGGPGDRSELWQVLVPGKTVRVKLTAVGLFFPYNNPETGSGGNEYSTVNRGYLNTPMIETRMYELSMTEDGEVLVDGKRAPEPEVHENPEDVRSREEGDRIMREEREERERLAREEKERVERENREYAERMEREQAEEKRRNEEALRKAEEESKRNEKHVQRRSKADEPTKKKQIMDNYDYHMKGVPGGEERMKDYLRKLIKAGGDWETAAREIVNEMGYEL